MMRFARSGVLLFVLLAFPVKKAFPLTPDEQNTIDIYQRVNASVVNITSIAVSYDFFFNPVPSQATGSGSIISKKGYILTNQHVVKDSRRLEVALADGSRWPGKLVGTDPVTDLAVVAIKAPPDRLTVIPIGDSARLRPGQKVMAIGNPFGLERTLTTGIISSIRKTLKTEDLEMEDVIQTDASINPGNSGGPLLDSDGKMVGINTAIFSPSGGSVGIGFAIPINTASAVLDQLILKGYVPYAWMGIELQTLVAQLVQALDLPVEHGAMVARIARGGPAARAGLRGGTREVEIGNTIVIIGGDILVSIGEEKVESAEAFYRILKRRKPGEIVRLAFYRGRDRREVDVQLGERPRG